MTTSQPNHPSRFQCRLETVKSVLLTDFSRTLYYIFGGNVVKKCALNVEDWWLQ